VPAPADLLLITCVHGACWNPIPSQRWVADAFAILGAYRLRGEPNTLPRCTGASRAVSAGAIHRP